MLPVKADVICLHTKDGNVVPLRIRVADEDGLLQAYSIKEYRDVSHQGQHFRVFKADTDEQTITHIEQLSPEQRIQEIARMLSGSDITPEALANAKTLITE